MTNDRPYRQALAFQVAMNEIAEGAGRQFDPRLATAFVDLAPTISAAAAA
jgi:HD-GYP domain-containing protein (c-di-GMP phosphodiesterase class II)